MGDTLPTKPVSVNAIASVHTPRKRKTDERNQISHCRPINKRQESQVRHFTKHSNSKVYLIFNFYKKFIQRTLF